MQPDVYHTDACLLTTITILPCKSKVIGSNPTQGRTQGFDLNDIARASVNAESLCIPISQVQ